MFRAAHRSSSEAPNCIFSLCFIYLCGDRPLSRLGWNSVPTQPGQRPVTTWVYKLEATNSLELLMMSDMPLETCWAFNKFWNNKFYYKFATCWLFLLIHTTMHEFMNIKSICTSNNVFLFHLLLTFAVFLSCCTFEGFVSSSNTLTTSLHCGY